MRVHAKWEHVLCGRRAGSSVKDENGVIFAGTKQQVEEYMIELLAVF